MLLRGRDMISLRRIINVVVPFATIPFPLHATYTLHVISVTGMDGTSTKVLESHKSIEHYRTLGRKHTGIGQTSPLEVASIKGRSFWRLLSWTL